MRFVADECLDRAIVEALRAGGHEVLYVAESSHGLSDVEVLALANRERALLVTDDKGFGELVFRQGLSHSGVMLLRLAGLAPHAKAMIVCTVVTDHEAELGHSFTLVTPRTVRVRRRG